MQILDLELLENVAHLPNGQIRARCPACAEAGTDSSGNHLLIRNDGRFGCGVNPGDKQHRSRIFALAKGQRTGCEPITEKLMIQSKRGAKRWLDE